MPTWLKVVLGIVVGGFLLCGLGVGGVVWWFDQNKGELKARGEAAMAEGKAFAEGKLAEECVTEALRRNQQDDGIVAGATHKMFLKACLSAAEVPEDFCASVPPRDEIMASATWALDACAERGLPGDQPCTRLVAAVQEHCAAR